MREQLASIITTESFATNQDTASSGGRLELRADVSKTGYTPLGIIQINISNSSAALSIFYINSSNMAVISARNFTSETISDVIADIIVLYKKNIFIQ